MVKAKSVQTVTIQWSRPYKIDNAIEREDFRNEKGVYCITRVFGYNETVIYIGMTNNQFHKRLSDHRNKWLDSYRGTKRVRFGTIDSIDISSMQTFEDIESGLIYEIQPQRNTSKRNSYTCLNTFLIKSKGGRGIIPPEINMKDHPRKQKKQKKIKALKQASGWSSANNSSDLLNKMIQFEKRARLTL